MRKQRPLTSVCSKTDDRWTNRYVHPINYNKGLDLLPKRGKMPILKRIKLWWTE